jgi:hypothetical protein
VTLQEVLDLVGLTGERFALAAIRDRKIKPAVFDDARKAEAWLTLHEDFNCYLTLNPVRPDYQGGGRPKADDILRSPWLLVDLRAQP